MGICTYTFGISLLIPKQHDKSSHFHNRFSRDLGQFFQISLVRFPGHLTHGICYIVAHEEVRVIFALLVRFGRDSSGGLGKWSGNSWVSSWSMACELAGLKRRADKPTVQPVFLQLAIDVRTAARCPARALPPTNRQVNFNRASEGCGHSNLHLDSSKALCSDGDSKFLFFANGKKNFRANRVRCRLANTLIASSERVPQALLPLTA